MIDNYSPFDNNIKYSTPFEYPFEDNTNETNNICDCNNKCIQMLTNLATYILPSDNPTLSLVCLLFASGIDLSYILNCNNTETDLAKKFGVSKQLVSLYCKRITKDFNLTHTPVLQPNKNRESCKYNHKRTKI